MAKWKKSEWYRKEVYENKCWQCMKSFETIWEWCMHLKGHPYYNKGRLK